MKEPRVRTLINKYKQGNLVKVYEYLTGPDMNVDPSTWSGQIKEMIEKKEFITAKAMIEFVAYKFIK
jgi:hypothetical protein